MASEYHYNWHAVADSRNIANTGWSVPTWLDYYNLSNYLAYNGYGYSGIQNQTAKSVASTSGWTIISSAGSPGDTQANNNSSGFNLTPVGYRAANGTYGSVGNICNVWTSTGDINNGTACTINYNSPFPSWAAAWQKTIGNPVRLKKDATSLTHGQTGQYTGNDGKTYPTICIGTQEWMSVHLAETLYRTGASIPTVTDNTTWAGLSSGAKCIYDNGTLSFTNGGGTSSSSDIRYHFNKKGTSVIDEKWLEPVANCGIGFDANLDPILIPLDGVITPLVTNNYHGIASRVVGASNPLPTFLTTTTFSMGTLPYYYRGKYVNIDGTKTCQLNGGASAPAGLYYIYFDKDTANIVAGSFPGISSTSNVLIAVVNWNGSDYGLVMDERHNATRNHDWHQWAHDTIGALYESGCTLTHNGGTGAAATFAVTAGVIHDEDIEFVVNAQTTGRLFWQTSASTYAFNKVLSAVPGYLGANGRPNMVNNSSYAVVQVGSANNRYVNVFVYAANDLSGSIYFITETASASVISNNGYNNLTAARAIPFPNLNGMGLGPELRPLYRLIWRADGVLQTIDTTLDDYRTVKTVPQGGGTANPTAALIPFTPSGNISGSNVQTAIEELDNEKAPLNSPTFTGTVSGITAAMVGAAPSSTVSFPGFGATAALACVGNDSRLSDARTPSSHAHGNITNAGAIGSTANLPVITGVSGALTVGSFGTAANTFCVGNDSRLSDARSASDVYAWAKAATKPSYTFSEITSKPTTLSGYGITDGGSSFSGTANYISKFLTGGTTIGNSQIFDDGTNIGIGIIVPTATLHIKAGTASVGTAPIKLTQGVKLTTAEVGAIELDTKSLFITPSSSLERIGFSTFKPQYSSGSNMFIGNIPQNLTGVNGESHKGSINIFVGPGYGGNNMTTAFNNVSFGGNFNNLTTGERNIAVGLSNFDALTSGGFNTGMGIGVFPAITVHGGNLGFGWYPGYYVTEGSDNIALGNYSMHGCTRAYQNTALGHWALAKLNDDNNIGVGRGALSQATNGSYNTALGNESGCYRADGTTANTNPINCVYVGATCRSGSSGTVYEEIVIGKGAIGNGSYTTTIGTSNTTDIYLKGKTHLKISDDTASAASTNVGTIRYRTSGNNSYLDMCMQTGASTYTWVNIKTNSW